MRKIDKTLHLATAYENALKILDEQQEDHPDYTQGAFRYKYYEDVFMNLFCCQQGVCAYTEIYLGNCLPIEETTCWENGKYRGDIECKELKGSIDHFDPLLKKKQGWKWENLFLVDSDINSKVKGENPVDDILKPDREGYNPYELLRYNFSQHRFVPQPGLPEDVKQRIRTMLVTLGINAQSIRDARESLLKECRKDIHSGLKTYETLRSQLREFFTAFDMSREELENEQD